MAEYLIYFNDQWVPDYTAEELREIATQARALVAEMKQAGVLLFTGGLDPEAPVFSVDASSGTPVFTDGPLVETKEYLGGVCVIEVPDEDSARRWAGRVATACRWPQEVRVFFRPFQLLEETDGLAATTKDVTR
jgi:hypothetical protein